MAACRGQWKSSCNQVCPAAVAGGVAWRMRVSRHDRKAGCVWFICSVQPMGDGCRRKSAGQPCRAPPVCELSDVCGSQLQEIALQALRGLPRNR